MNKLFCCDNLDLLLDLKDDSIDLIYCDILFGTGNKFKDYIDLQASKSKIIKHYSIRFFHMYRILKSTGSIYIHCDTKINHWVRDLLDRHFGYENFKNEIVWNVEYRLRQNKNKYSEFGERILFYTKSNDYYFDPPQVAHLTSKKHQEACKNAPSVKSGKFKTPFKETKNAGDVWNDIKSLTYKSKENTWYSTQKPEALLERIILASSKEEDIVADFYCGSGTTPVIAKKLNRQYIACDINPEAIKITEKRLNNL